MMISSPTTSRVLFLAAALLALQAPGAAPAGAADAEVRTVDLGGLEARSAALLLSGQEGGELETSFLVRPVPSKAAGSSYLVVADLVGASLLDAVGAAQMIVEVYAYALDGAGQPRASLTRAFRLDLGAFRERLATGGVKFLARLEVPEGAAADRVRLLVLHRASGRFSLATLRPGAAAAAEDPAAAPAELLVLERAEPWIVARGAGELLPDPAGEHSLPATRLIAAAGGALPLGLTARGRQGVAARLLDADEQPLGALALRPSAPASEDAAGEVVLDLAGRTPGSYLLELAIAGEPGSALRLPLVMVPEQLAAGAVWFRSPAAEEQAAPELAEAPPAGRSPQGRLALAAYLRAFEVWAEKGLDSAAARMRRFEAEATTSRSTSALSIQEGQVRAAAELVAHDGEALVPLMCLHERLYRSYRQLGSPLLARHSQHLAGEFARLYAGRGGRQERRLAALVPVSLAGVRQDMGTRLDAQAAFERALELDPTQPAALLGLAALHESLAHYETAVELLRQLDRSGTMSPAARIRLAVNLGRVGSSRQALALLGELADGEPEWVSRLAYQERARLLAASQRPEEALEVLVEARRRYPADQSLTLQQAALLDRLGKPLAGQRVLAAIADLTTDRGDSPRLRYSELPSGGIEAARARLAREASERLAGVIAAARRIQLGGGA